MHHLRMSNWFQSPLEINSRLEGDRMGLRSPSYLVSISLGDQFQSGDGAQVFDNLLMSCFNLPWRSIPVWRARSFSWNLICVAVSISLGDQFQSGAVVENIQRV